MRTAPLLQVSAQAPQVTQRSGSIDIAVDMCISALLLRPVQPIPSCFSDAASPAVQSWHVTCVNTSRASAAAMHPATPTSRSRLPSTFTAKSGIESATTNGQPMVSSEKPLNAAVATSSSAVNRSRQ